MFNTNGLRKYVNGRKKMNYFEVVDQGVGLHCTYQVAKDLYMSKVMLRVRMRSSRFTQEMLLFWTLRKILATHTAVSLTDVPQK